MGATDFIRKSRKAKGIHPEAIQTLSDLASENAAQVAAKLAKPSDNTDITLGFRKKMVTQFVVATIKEALK